MSIQKTCPYCGGRGYITHIETLPDCGRAWIKQCIACEGTGLILYTETNADRIRAMSDEELANTMYSNPIFIVCDAVCKGDCAAIDTLNDTKEDACKRTILEWLQQPAEEDT